MNEILFSINKISLLAFIITLGFLVYEFKLLKKEKKSNSKPQIPKFNSNYLTPNWFQNTPIQKESSLNKKNTFFSNKFIIVLLILMLLFFAGYTTISFINQKNKEKLNRATNNNQIQITTLASQGIKIYTDNNEEIKQSQIDQYPVGTILKIGVESIKEADIDKARIRVNELKWLADHETKNYDVIRNYYYINYKIATIPAQLKIEAQLHSIKDGWLGD